MKIDERVSHNFIDVDVCVDAVPRDSVAFSYLHLCVVVYSSGD